MTTKTSEGVIKCTRQHFREATACPHFLETCNLCGEMSFCERHGCYNCKLKWRDHNRSLLATPDKERRILIEVSQRPLKRRDAPVKRKKYANRRNYREAWLDDLIASNS